MPSIQRTLLLRVDACPGSPIIEGAACLSRGVDFACVHGEEITGFRKALARKFRLKIQGNCWINATLDALGPLREHVRDLARQRTARFGSGFLTERLVDSDRTRWYRLAPPRPINPRNRKSGAAELLSQPWQVHASSRFRQAVERANLTGLTFGEPREGPIRGDARHWYSALPSALAGRGLDHVWTPPREEPVREGIGRIGADHANGDTVAVDRLDPEVAALCREFPQGLLGLSIHTYLRFWGPSLPDTDFAGYATITGDRRWQVQQVLVRRPAAEILIRAGVLTPDSLEPVEVVETRDEAGVAILDEEIGPFHPSLLAMVASRRSVPLGDPPIPETPAPPDFARIFAARASRLAEDPVDADEIRAVESQLGLSVPGVWRLFLTTIGMREVRDLAPWCPAAWVDEQPDPDELRSLDETLPARMVAVGITLNGDWYALDLDHVTPDGDCPLLFFDHENSRCVNTWPSTASFLVESLDELGEG